MDRLVPKVHIYTAIGLANNNIIRNKISPRNHIVEKFLGNTRRPKRTNKPTFAIKDNISVNDAIPFLYGSFLFPIINPVKKVANIPLALHKSVNPKLNKITPIKNK